MRITCPNCGARYEVAEDAIPEGGRDVQCSACGHVWFVAAAGAATPAPDVPDATPEPEPPQPDRPEPPPPEPAADDPAPVPVPRRPALSPEVTAILREEAERERARREAERAAQQFVAQPDLGLDGMAPTPAPERIEPARPVPPDTAPAADPAPEAPRGRARLPDIEEINASLRAAAERAPAHVGEAAQARGRGGFRAGFLTVLSLATLALAAYVAAPRIAASVPAAEPALARYVAGVDRVRLWLDLQVQGVLPAD
ncbi:MAG: zinc-ribbon domain-containing protein [Rubellimicrobium sp.]|nr:zinc-ribbon domain-containing protein [Rubellimicrobium sp.]